jgi:hypothetical protein
MRLVNALQAGGTLTTTELCALLPDLPKATVYRHVEQLLGGGVFEIESEHRRRGAVERRYRLSRGGALVDAGSARSMTMEEHRGGFTAAMGAILAEFNAYLDRDGSSPTEDGVSYRQMTLWLTRSERWRLIDDVTKLLRRALKNQPRAGRAPHLLSTIFFPTAKAGGTRRRPVAR